MMILTRLEVNKGRPLIIIANSSSFLAPLHQRTATYTTTTTKTTATTKSTTTAKEI
jgi:hypothetical protein